jgi:hypothetical protein
MRILLLIVILISGCAGSLNNGATDIAKSEVRKNCHPESPISKKCPSIDGVRLTKTYTDIKTNVDVTTRYTKFIEFIPESESFSEWTRLVSYKSEPLFAIDNDPKQFGHQFLNMINSNFPDSRPGFSCSSLESGETDKCVLSFALKNNRLGITEINLFVFSKASTGDAVVQAQYARRVTLSTSDSEVQSIRLSLANQVDSQYDKEFIESIFSNFESWQ